jgi:hypothetical protein
MIVKDVLDQKNFWIWEILQNRYTIIQTWHESTIINYRISDNTIELHLPKQDMSYEEFTHELLRIYLKVIERIYLTEYLIFRSNETPLMQWFFNSSDLFETIGTKMEDSRIRSFLSLNQISTNTSEKEQPYIDYYFKFLQQLDNGNKWTSPAVCMFLKCYFLITSTAPYNKENLIKLEKLKSLNVNLFSISDTFNQSWTQFEIRAAPCCKEYKTNADCFISSLFSWALRNMKPPSFQL